MNASPFLLLLLLSICHGKEQDDSPIGGILPTTKGQNKVETHLEVSCPDPTDIEPCVCSNQFEFIMDCSKVQDEDQLRKIFSAFFPSTDFQMFYMWENKGVKVLEDGVFGNVSFQKLEISYSVLETVKIDSLTPSLSTLTKITIAYCQLAIFPFERLAEFTSLKTLNLNFDKIQSVPPLSSSSLQSLQLRQNPISHLSPNVFTLLPAIQSIHLERCNLTEITPGTFRDLPELKYLFLSWNNISYLQSLTFDLAPSSSHNAMLSLDNNNIDFVEVDAFKGVQRFSIVAMMRNGLTTLEEEVWRPVLEKGIEVRLQVNPLSCGCDVAWIVRYPPFLLLIPNATCADGTLVKDLNPADFDTCG